MSAFQRCVVDAVLRTHPETVEGNKFHSHGQRKMKAGVACMAIAAKAIKNQG